MIDPYRRYAVTLPVTTRGHAPPAVVVVHRTGALGPGGNPVWASADGGLRVEIAGRVAAVLAAPPGSARHPCLDAVPLP
ncbi:DUF6296 family protein [Kitasatospora sp. NPDC056184]|uniref:DUF6296 family protein n=1 Tax=Kitasatospora sp. NPDC056184 TaxID=3345738 RepID=UPI0035DA7A71